MSMRPYSYHDWGITPAEYDMLIQAKDQRIVTDRQIENNRYFFIWGEETVAEFIQRLDWQHRFISDIAPARDFIDQREFENICLEVIKEFPDVFNPHFEYGEFHFAFPSHSRKSRLGGALYFDDGGYITGHRWKYSSSYDANLPHIIGKRISNKIKSARYA